MADFEVNRRLKKLITEYYKVTPFAFSQKYNDNGGVKTSQIMRERNGLSMQLLEQIVKAYPEINRDWLLTGRGEMTKETTPVLPSLTATKADKIVALNNIISNFQQNSKKRGSIHFIPLMNIDAVGGLSNDTCDAPEYIEELFPVIGATESSIGLPVSGDSMMPVFLPGDIVVIDEVLEWSLFLEMGQYYVIALKDNRRLIKKVTYSETDRMQNFLLLSENPKYPPVELPKTLIHRVFIVTQKHQKLTL